MHTNLWSENPNGSEHIKNIDIDWRIVLKFALKKREESVQVIHLAQDRDRCQTLCEHDTVP
jgi:hypothetical protein